MKSDASGLFGSDNDETLIAPVYDEKGGVQNDEIIVYANIFGIRFQ